VKHELIKHVGVDCFYVRSAVQDKITALQYVPSEIQLVDLPRPILKLNIVFFFPNSMWLIHLEFERGGGVREMYSFFYFPFVEGSICKATLYILAFWPMDRVSCHCQFS
jgi:hypothetical protein